MKVRALTDPRVGNRMRWVLDQAQANADLFGIPYYVNMTSDGIRAERSRILVGWAGNRTVAEIKPKSGS